MQVPRTTRHDEDGSSTRVRLVNKIIKENRGNTRHIWFTDPSQQDLEGVEACIVGLKQRPLEPDDCTPKHGKNVEKGKKIRTKNTTVRKTYKVPQACRRRD